MGLQAAVQTSDQGAQDRLQRKPEIYRLEFDGGGLGLALIMLKNLALTIVTLGIYNFWGRTNTRRYIWKHVKFHGERFEYTGTGRELFIGWLKIIAGYVLLGAVFFGLKMISPLAFGIGAVILGLSIYFIFLPAAIFLSRRYKLSRTQWRGINLGMSDLAGFIKTFAGGILLCILTLGLYTPWFDHYTQKGLKERSWFGNVRLMYDGSGKDMAWAYLKLILFIVPTLGLYGAWFSAWRIRYRASHTIVGGARMRTKVKGLDILLLNIFCIVFAVCTLGLATPWLIAYVLDFYTYRTALIGHLDFEAIAKGEHAGSAAGDQLGSLMDVDVGF